LPWPLLSTGMGRAASICRGSPRGPRARMLHL
jgi:hypothetical protein